MPTFSAMLDQLMHTISAVGYDKTQQVLRDAEFGGMNFPDKVFEFVVCEIASQFEISANEIVFGVGRKNDRKMAIGFCVFYLKGMYKYPMETICKFLNKGNSACMKGCAMVEKLNTRSRHIVDVRYIEFKNHFDKIFTPELKK